MKLLARTLALVLLIAPFVVFGADDFVPLAPIPNLDTGSNATLGSYINSLFFLIISVAAMLAVIKVVIGGFQYMTQTSSTSATAKARETIRDAIIGLILLLSSYLILSIINPQILTLEALRFSALSPSGTTRNIIEQNRADHEARLQKARDDLNPAAMSVYVDEDGKEIRYKTIDTTNLTAQEKSAYISVCRNEIGGTVRKANVTVCTDEKGESRISNTLKWFSWTEYTCKSNETSTTQSRMSCVAPGG